MLVLAAELLTDLDLECLVDGQVDAGVGDDTEEVGPVALVEHFPALRLEDLLGTVQDTCESRVQEDSRPGYL